MLKGVSLFANIGVGELSLPSNFRVIAANDIDPKRCNLYKKLHPHTNVIDGDISKKTILNLSLIHVSEPPRQEANSYAVFC